MRVTWKHVHGSKFPALADMARRAGLDTAGWTLDSRGLVLGDGGPRFCAWATARECNDYLQAWIDALSIVVLTREASARPATHDDGVDDDEGDSWGAGGDHDGDDDVVYDDDVEVYPPPHVVL